MTTTIRCGNKWTISEVLSLQREYELLEWTVPQIAEKHKRSEKAILFKLQNEGFISSWDEARGFDVDKYKAETNGEILSHEESKSCLTETKNKENENLDTIDEIDANERFEEITNRISNLETNIRELNSMVKQMFEVMVYKNVPKRRPLRNY